MTGAATDSTSPVNQVEIASKIDRYHLLEAGKHGLRGGNLVRGHGDGIVVYDGVVWTAGKRWSITGHG